MPPRSSRRGGAQSSGSLASLFGSHHNVTRSEGQRVRTGEVSNFSLSDLETFSKLRQDILNSINGGKSGINDVLIRTHRDRTLKKGFKEGGDDEIEVSTIEFSLHCPYSMNTMTYPVRSRDCCHVQCCDLDSWIKMLKSSRSMRDPVVDCPLCKNRVAASTLEVDCWQLHVLSQMPSGTHLVILDKDGSYRSGDALRNQKREQITEIIDSSQFHDDRDECGSCTPSPDSAYSLRGGETGMDHRIRIKNEQLSEERPEPPSTEFSQVECVWSSSIPSPPTQSDDLVIVCYIEGKQPRRVLSSQARRWIAHCPNCKMSLGKSEDATVECCAKCALGPDVYTFVRHFPDSLVSLELTRDGTLLLRGVDEMASHLSRAGFHRSGSCDESSTNTLGGNIGLWYTTDTLSRTELDFLEACCQRLASGEPVNDIPSVPFRFRVPTRRSRSIYGGVGGGGGGEVGPTQASYCSLSR